MFSFLYILGNIPSFSIEKEDWTLSIEVENINDITNPYIYPLEKLNGV